MFANNPTLYGATLPYRDITSMNPYFAQQWQGQQLPWTDWRFAQERFQSEYLPYTQALYGNRFGPTMPYPQVPFGQIPFGQSSFGQVPFGQSSFGQVPFGQVPFGHAPFGQMYGMLPHQKQQFPFTY